MPVKLSISPSVNVSPIEMVPWLWMPITSPGYALSAISRSLTFMASDREIAAEAWPGDVIGIHNHGTISIGDTFTEGEAVTFTGIPNFAPELFRRARLKDPLKLKQLQKGLAQLSEEGLSLIHI